MAALQAPSLSGEEVLGIDAGTQGLSVVLFCPKRSLILGVGESPYEASAIAGLPEGRVEQRAKWWSVATANAMATLRDAIRRDYGGEEIVRVAGIGVTGHMHCLVRKTEGGSKPLGCDMWNDPRGVPESLELSSLFGESIPSRWTGSHILASMVTLFSRISMNSSIRPSHPPPLPPKRQVPDEWTKVDGVNVTSGSIVHDLTGKWVLGPGDASGMFGQLDKNGQIDRAKLRKLDELVGRDGGKVARPMEEMVPRVIRAGEIAGVLSEAGSTLLGGIPVGTPVAAPEGDQQSVLVGSGIGENELALSAGTSFSGSGCYKHTCFRACRLLALRGCESESASNQINLVACKDLLTSTRLKAESEAYNVLHAPDGDTMLMICARNGTVGFARYVESLASLTGSSFQSIADKITERAAALPVDPLPDVVPFWQGENVAELPLAKAEITNAGIDFLSDNPAVMARLLLEGPCMTMRYGIEV